MKSLVHRMRCPTEEYDRLTVLFGTGNLRQHTLFGGLDDFKSAHSHLVLLDQGHDKAVAVVARFDPVDLAVKGVLVLADVAEVLDAQFGALGVGGKRVLGTFEIGSDGFNRLVVQIRLDVLLLCRHPVAEEHIDVLVLQRLIGDRYGEDLDVRLVAEALQDDRGGGGGCGNVRPAYVRETDGRATFGFCGK